MTQEFHTYWSLDTPILIKWFMPGPLASSQMGHPTFKIAAAVRSSKVAGREICPGGGRLPVAPLPHPIATTQEALGGGARKSSRKYMFHSAGLPAGQLLHPGGKAPNTYLTGARAIGQLAWVEDQLCPLPG